MQRHKIEGVVLDTNHNPLEGVSVQIYRPSFRQLNRIGYGRTERDGRYIAEFEAGSSVIVRYDHFPGGLDDCHPAMVSHIAGQSDHTVNIVLYKVGRPYEQDELLEILAAYERVYLIDVSHNVPVKEIKSTYRGGLGMMKYVDEITRQRYEQVIGLYDTGE
jgi:hypothetical protein